MVSQDRRAGEKGEDWSVWPLVGLPLRFIATHYAATAQSVVSYVTSVAGDTLAMLSQSGQHSDIVDLRDSHTTKGLEILIRESFPPSLSFTLNFDSCL